MSRWITASPIRARAACSEFTVASSLTAVLSATVNAILADRRHVLVTATSPSSRTIAEPAGRRVSSLADRRWIPGAVEHFALGPIKAHGDAERP